MLASSAAQFDLGAAGTQYIGLSTHILLVSWDHKLFPCHPSEPFFSGQLRGYKCWKRRQPQSVQRVRSKRSEYYCSLQVGKSLFSCFQLQPCGLCPWLEILGVKFAARKRGKESRASCSFRGKKKCWRLKIVYVNMPYWLLKAKGGSASLTLPGWCLKVWEWTAVVTN